MIDIKTLIRKRGSAKARLTSFANYVENVKNRQLSKIEFIEFEERLKRVELVLSEYSAIHENILEVADDGDLDDHESQREAFENDLFKICAIARSLINASHETENLGDQSMASSTGGSFHDTVHNNSTIKLPTLKLPEFDGSFDKWLGFYDTFKSVIHLNASLSKVQKFHYLSSSLVRDAVQVIRGLEISGDNYEAAWELLQRRYQNKGLMIHNHIKCIVEYPNIQKTGSEVLRTLSNVMQTHIRALQALQQPVESWGSLLIYLITDKFDSSTKKEWEKLSVNRAELPTVNNMSEFLECQCQLLEKIAKSSSDSNRQNVGKSVSRKSTLSSSIAQPCPMCNQQHALFACGIFLKLSINNRIAEARRHNRCINCLKVGHMASTCQSKGCRKCGKMHNTLLHLEKRTEESKNTSLATSTHLNKELHSFNILPTAIVDVIDNVGNAHECTVLLDSGSQSNFLSTTLCKKLMLRTAKMNLNIVGISGHESIISQRAEALIKSKHSNFEAFLQFLVTPQITSQLPSEFINIHKLKLPQGIKLADPTFHKPKEIDMLIGVDLFWDILSYEPFNHPYLHKTKLRFVVSGSIPMQQQFQRTRCCNTSILSEQLRKFWEIEECPRQEHFSAEEKACEQNFITTTKRDEDGRFVVTIPFKASLDSLGDASEQAKRRFQTMERKLQRNKTLKEKYVKFMQEYQDLQHMSLVDENQYQQHVYYLPHHGVLKENSLTTKLRVVFDGSAATSSGMSLNDLQMVGPVMQQDLLSILLHFRQYPYAVGADITMMFRQIHINPEQRSLQRIFWRSDPSEPMLTYELNTVTYGLASSSYLAIRCLFQLAEENEQKFPKIAKIIRNNMYVDDLLYGANTIEEAIDIQKQISSILTSAGFQLRKWISNEPTILNEVQDSEQNLECQVIRLGENDIAKTLGLSWSCATDELIYELKNEYNAKIHTKRTIASAIARIYDPLGVLGPFVLKAKIILQKLWLCKLSWDDPLPSEINTEWESFIASIASVERVRIPRQACCTSPITVEILAFSDASESAYGACVYVRSIDTSGRVFVNLLTAKSRVSPLKCLKKQKRTPKEPVRIPKLELCAALLCAKLVERVRSCWDINIDHFYYWCDSTIVLGWLKQEPYALKTFVSNRVYEIQSLTNVNQWFHVSSGENPADLLSRGALPQLLGDFWWKGPTWLSLPNYNLTPAKIEEDLPELKTLAKTAAISYPSTKLISFEYSNLDKLERIMAYCLRFINNTRRSKSERTKFQNITINEIRKSHSQLVKLSQYESFSEEIKCIIEEKKIKKGSKLSKLNPFIHSDGTLRVRGRLENSNYSFCKRHPIILNSKHHLTKLIFKREHQRLLHVGPQTLLSYIRDKYWPICGRESGEYSYNHVDRVRINQLAATPPGCPIAGSRRRQNIGSHLDLATAKIAQQYYPHVQYNQRYSDHNNNKNHLNLEDYYSHVHSAESQKFEENYYESYENNYSGEDKLIYSKEDSCNDVCSLRRTRSLAVIREETYNDLQISSTRNSRRSQLIPRAKLVHRSLIKDRYYQSKQHKREEDSTGGSGVETQTFGTRDTDEYYTNLKRLDSAKNYHSSWQNEKSDLDSINSDYFKNSQHQTSEFAESKRKSGTPKFQVLDIELHQESSVLPETTTSNSEHSDSSTPGRYSKTCTDSEACQISEDTATLTKGDTEENRPVISYDSVYLSSEESSGDTLHRSANTKKIASSSEAELFEEISLSAGGSIDRLYTKVNKATNPITKPKILSVTTKRGALERLTCISTSQILKSNEIHGIDAYRPNLIDNQYCSLPDVNIGRSLKVSERIDAKLRSSYRQYQDSTNSEGSLTSTPTLRKPKRARQREVSEIDSLTSSNISFITIGNSISSNAINQEDSSLVEAENQQSEIVVTQDTLLQENQDEPNYSLPENKQENITETSSVRGDFLLSETTLNFPGQIRIIVTDSQNNIIEEDSIESSAGEVSDLTYTSNNFTLRNCKEVYNNEPDETQKYSTAIDPIDIHQRHIQPGKHTPRNNKEVAEEDTNPTCSVTRGILKKDYHYKGKAEIHFPPPPAITFSPSPGVKTTFESVFKATSSVNHSESCSNEVELKASKMSRPQIIQVIDSKRYQQDGKGIRESKGNVEKEYMEKVDSVRCYWSKIAQDENSCAERENINKSPERNFVKSLEDEVDSTTFQSSALPRFSPTENIEPLRIFENGHESFSPTVEIVELNGEKQATIVKAHDVDQTDFDHVRYKVMRPDQFQKDVLNRSKKEAQFDGLLQYLQDYSFQELLSKNNIVIIEPVRTKIEKPVEATTKLEPLNCKITGGSGIDTKSNLSKHHFFYQPVRVNRELLEEELPNPDTVRNVRKFFEEHGLQKQPTDAAIKSNTLDSSPAGKRRSLRYLTIDTSYGSAGIRKWDSASLSSGISSGDLSSPCECNEEHNRNHNDQHTSQHHQHNDDFKERRGAGDDEYDGGHEPYNSEENLYEDEMCGGESYYVSEDVLEKIRECGSTITYYGGRVVDNKSPEISPMTRAIMEEIRGKEASCGDSMKTMSIANSSKTERTCRACQPNECPRDDDIERRFRDSKHLGIQFKLVKSNSCSSRLELVGTEKCCQTQSTLGTANHTNRTPSPNRNPEESVRELVNRLESGTINNSSTPRIIESKCIEKPYRRSLPPIKSVDTNNAITINNHHIGTKEYLGLVDIINHVTVNNHHGSIAQNTKSDDKLYQKLTTNNKIPRNKNVDLAFTMCRGGQTANCVPTPIHSPKSADDGGGLITTIEHNSENQPQNETKNYDISIGEINKIVHHQNKSPSENGTSKNPNTNCNKENSLANIENMKSVSETNGCGQTMRPPSGQSALFPSSGDSTPIKLLGKHYVANDRRLIEQQKYDEIEFEEFEVYNPGISTGTIYNSSNNNDSANVKKEQISTTIVESFEERI